HLLLEARDVEVDFAPRVAADAMIEQYHHATLGTSGRAPETIARTGNDLHRASDQRRSGHDSTPRVTRCCDDARPSRRRTARGPGARGVPRRPAPAPA